MDQLDETRSGAGLVDLSGEQVGRYLLDKRLGSGGVATVYRAYDQVQGRTVAFKVLAPTADSKAVTRFRREALTAGALRHPNIVRTLQVGTAREGEVAYIAMELVEGENLADLLTRHGTLRPEETCNLLEPIASGLAFAHRSNIIHRDVKPSNILLRASSPGSPHSVRLESLEFPVTPMLSDFGVARVLDAPELTNIGRTVGTPAYMAPEQCAGSREIDGRADIYALGTVLYRCVVGHLPFSGTTTQILHAHVYSPLTIEDHLLRQLPPIVVDILQRSLAKRPEDRYPEMSAMAAELAEAAGKRPVAVEGVAPEPAAMTATLTLSALPAVRPDTTQVNGAILVPAPGSPPHMTVSSSPSRPQTPRPDVAWRWLGLAFVGIAILLFSATITGALLPRLGRPLPAATGQVNLALLAPSPTATAADVGQATVAAVSEGRGAEMPERPDNLPGGESGSALVSTATTQKLNVLPTPALTPADTPTLLPTLTSAPEPVATYTATPSAEPTQAPLPTSTPTPTPTPSPDNDVVFACSYIAQPIFGESILGMDPQRREGFRCPTGIATATAASQLQFQHGFMLQLDEEERIFVYYAGSNQWEWTDDRPREEEPRVDQQPTPPSSDLSIPEGIFGHLWTDPQRQVELGFATAPVATSLSVVMQKFPGGILVGVDDGDVVYQFFDSDLTFR